MLTRARAKERVIIRYSTMARGIRRLSVAARSVCGLAAENYRQRIAASCSSTRSALEAPRAKMRGAAADRVHGLEAARTLESATVVQKGLRHDSGAGRKGWTEL